MTTADWADQPVLDPGNDFEQRFWGILRRRYRPEELVYLPSTMGGDCGIEGYSSDGVAYQCYADRDSLNLRHRTDKQKKKLYDDTCKLNQYKDRLKKVLGDTILRHYFLVVPEFHAVELVSYANDRATAVLAFALPFIDPDFKIHIKVPGDYPAEMAAAMADGLAMAIVPEATVGDEQIQLFSTDKPDLLSKLENKMAPLSETLESSTDFRDSFVRAFLRKERIMASLKAWPQTWEAVERRRILKEEELEFQNEIDTSDNRDRLNSLIGSYAKSLASSVPSLTEVDAQRISYGQVADWLMRCPLKLKDRR